MFTAPNNCRDAKLTVVDAERNLWVVENAEDIIAKANLHRIKGYFRRGQARCFLGDWERAKEDYEKALELKPGDPTIVRKMEELKSLCSLSFEEQKAWVSEQAQVTLLDIFEPGELKRWFLFICVAISISSNSIKGKLKNY